MNRYITLLAITTMCSVNIMAQKATLPMVEEGRTWHVVSLHPAEKPAPGTEGDYYQDLKGQWCVGSPHDLALKGDTIMGGVAYARLVQDADKRFVCGLRQDGPRVYERYPGDDLERLAFDFSLQEGDVFVCSQSAEMQMRVGRVDTVCINGFQRKRMQMCDYEDGVENSGAPVDVWIEGIGCLNGPSSPFWWSATGSSQPLLTSCHQDKHILFSSENFGFPVVNSLPSIRIQPAGTSAIYNLQGHRLKALPSKGIYIRDGKKIMK